MSDTEASSTDKDDSSRSSSNRKPPFVRTEECQEEMEECLRSKIEHVQSIKKVHDDLKQLTSVFQNILDCMENAKENKVREIKEFNGLTKESLNLLDGDETKTMWKMLKELERKGT